MFKYKSKINLIRWGFLILILVFLSYKQMIVPIDAGAYKIYYESFLRLFLNDRLLIFEFMLVFSALILVYYQTILSLSEDLFNIFRIIQFHSRNQIDYYKKKIFFVFRIALQETVIFNLLYLLVYVLFFHIFTLNEFLLLEGQYLRLLLILSSLILVALGILENRVVSFIASIIFLSVYLFIFSTHSLYWSLILFLFSILAIVLRLFFEKRRKL